VAGRIVAGSDHRDRGGGGRGGGGHRHRGGRGHRRRDDLHLLRHLHVQRIILAVFALDRDFGQVIGVQKLCKGLDEGHVGRDVIFAHGRPR